MTEQQERELAFLEDTISYYSEDPVGRRSINPKSMGVSYRPRCEYLMEDGRRCAIGRHFPDKLLAKDLIGSVNRIF